MFVVVVLEEDAKRISSQRVWLVWWSEDVVYLFDMLKQWNKHMSVSMLRKISEVCSIGEETRFNILR
eukprot:3325346-Amphidinium_carterae.1